MKRQQKKRRRARGRPEASSEKSAAMARRQRARTAAHGAEMRPDQDLLRRLDVAGKALERIESGTSPTSEELASAPRLDFWCIAEDGLFPVLQGVVTGHPLLGEGSLVATSPLLWISPDQTAARTLSRYYRLGEPLSAAPNQSN